MKWRYTWLEGGLSVQGKSARSSLQSVVFEGKHW